jgi:hypothetical protein
VTTVFYPDCKATSPNCAYTITAKSPFNGEVLDRVGNDPRRPEDMQWPCHQRDFRYQLVDQDNNILWERWQPTGEESPAELLVSNDGIVVVRTHGCNPEIIVLFTDGELARIAILAERDTSHTSQLVDAQSCFVVDVMHETTAGCYWTDHSWPYFTEVLGSPLFVWRTSTGQRIVIDLRTRKWLASNSKDVVDLTDSLDDVEANSACQILEELANQKPYLLKVFRERVPNSDFEDKLALQLHRLSAAVLIVAKQKLRQAARFLIALEELDCTECYKSFDAIGIFTHVEVQTLRLIIQYTLRTLDVLPGGFSPYFVLRNKERRSPLDVERIAMRKNQQELLRRASKLSFLARPRRVLARLGTPDHIVGVSGMWWNESWEYHCKIDEKWWTIRIHWKHFAMFWSRLASVKITETQHDDFDQKLRSIEGETS